MSGHHFEYVHASRQALVADGHDVVVFAHEQCDLNLAQAHRLVPFFHETWTMKTRSSALGCLAWLGFRSLGLSARLPQPLRSFGGDLLALVNSEKIRSGDQVFIHTLSLVQLLQVAQVQIRNPSVIYHIVLRQDPNEQCAGGLKGFFLRWMFRCLPKAFRFYSDTRSLCSVYEALSRSRFRLLPILFDQNPYQMQNAVTQDATIITYLGDARLEKGFQHLPLIIRQTHALSPAVEFHLQVYLRADAEREPLLREAQAEIRNFAAREPSKLRIFERPLDADDYLKLLMSATAVLIPYERDAYQRRSSGILAQTIAAAKIAIVPSRTGLADEAPKILCREYERVDEIPQILVNLKNNLPLPAIRNDAARSFCEFHSAKNFARQFF